MSIGNRVFWIVQGLFKYLPFGWCVPVRGLLYRPFFAAAGRRLAVHDNVLIKYPDEIRLGDHVTINPGCILVGRGGLTIGSDAMIGAGTKIVTTSHVTARTDLAMRHQGMTASPVVIEDDVWFGFDVKVMPGAVIRRGSVLGAGAVVTGEIPAWSVAAGVPARVISSRQT
jgi:acetyltransferase-like isoleucine patch superfamily enzyme